MSNVSFRQMTFGVTRAKVRQGVRGSQYLQADAELQPYPLRMTDKLVQWAYTKPEQLWMARRVRPSDQLERATVDDWHQVNYAQAWATARSIAQGLIKRGLSANRPVAILSENSLEHALLVLGCMVAGVPFVPVSPAYSLIDGNFEKLKHVLQTVTPGLLFASDAARYGKAISAVADNDVEVVLVNGVLDDIGSISFSELTSTFATSDVDAAMSATGPDTIVKFLFTSGSTKLPKAVINTHRMLCANQQQVAQAMTVMTDSPLVLVDWLPWSHTFGGNQNFGMVLYHGGSMYIDDGKPTASAISETLRNLRDISPTVYFNVPIGFEMIAEAMKSDAVLRKTLMSRVKMFFYAAASMPQSVWNSLYESAELELGKRIVVASGLGMTETGPHCLFGTRPQLVAGELGLPAPGMEVKLIEVGDKTEIRYKGPNVTPGYWRAPEATTAHFDEEGFFCSGDAVKWIDQKDINRGLSFDGRLAEDFKLSTGTFVSVGPLRSKIINAGAPYIQDVVITGHSFKELGALVFPSPSIYSLSKLPADASMHSAIECDEVQNHFQNLMNELASASTGSASRIARMCLLADPPSLARGELTDKGSINQRAVLSHRAQTVLRLHADDLPNIIKPKG